MSHAGESPLDWSLFEFSQRAGSKHVYELYGVPDQDFLKSEILMAYSRAMLVILAIHGEDATPESHAPFLNFLVATPMGTALSFQAETAREVPAKWKRFVQAARFPFFVRAWVIFTKHHGSFGDSSPEETVLEILRSGEKTQPGTVEAFLAEDAKKQLQTPGTTEFQAFCESISKALGAREKRKSRNRKERSGDPYKSAVIVDFFANSLWCRSTSDIVSEYFPESTAEEHEKHEKRFNKAFSSLNLSEARCTNIPECPDTEG